MSDKVNFCVKNIDNEVFELSSEQTVKDLRDLLLKNYDKEDKDYEIFILIDRPIRSFSILTLNPGELTDVYDHEKMNRFDIIGKKIDINIEFCEKKVIKKREYKSRFNLSYLNRYNNELQELEKSSPKSFVYNEDDFPPL